MASIRLSRVEAEDGDLPDVCMCCGAPALERKVCRFNSYPLWVVPALLWNVFNSNPLKVFLLLLWDWRLNAKAALTHTKHIRCYILFCPRHENYWLIRNLIVWASFVVIVVLLVGGLVLAGSLSGRVSRSTQDILFGSWCIGFVVLLLCWLLSIPISQMTAIHPTIDKQYQLILKRVSPAFVEAVRQHREKGKGRIQMEDYREHFPRRHSRRQGEGDDERIVGL